MKTLFITLITLVLGFQGVAYAQNSNPSTIGFKELVGRLDANLASTMESKYKDVQLSHFKVGTSHIEFRLNRLPIYMKWVGSEKVALEINGVAFSPKEMDDTKNTRLALIKKFKLKAKKWSLWSFLFPQAQAQVETEAAFESEVQVQTEDQPKTQNSKLLTQFLGKALASAKSGGFYNLGVLVAAMGAPQAEAFVYIMTLASGGFANFMTHASAVPAIVDPASIAKPSFMAI